jgi:hypothetical protein
MELTSYSLRQRLVQLIAERSDPRIVAVARGDTAASAAFDRAIGHFEHGHWSQAFEELVPLADAGDREAARIAMLMTTTRSAPFRPEFPGVAGAARPLAGSCGARPRGGVDRAGSGSAGLQPCRLDPGDADRLVFIAGPAARARGADHLTLAHP